jgi:uncharacterized protein YggE
MESVTISLRWVRDAELGIERNHREGQSSKEGRQTVGESLMLIPDAFRTFRNPLPMEALSMTETVARSISVQERFDLEARPDVAVIKFHFTGEGMSMEDAVVNVRKKVSEAIETLKSKHDAIRNITVFDIYFGQKEERLRGEGAHAFPRPLVVQGVLLTAPPDELRTLYRIVDDGIRCGAVLSCPHSRSYLSDTLDSSLLFGLVDSEKDQHEAIERCLNRAAHRSQLAASSAGQKIGKLMTVSDVAVEPSMSEPFRWDYGHIRRSFPTRFLSPTPQTVLLCASLTAKFELLDS